VIALGYAHPRAPHLYDVEDLPWIAQLLDLVEASLGEPWRVLVERVERAPLRSHSSQRVAMLQALRRVLGGSGAPAGTAELDAIWWLDLAMARPVELPTGRPAEVELAAFANLESIQRCVRRSHELRIRVWDRADELARTIARHGLLAQARRHGDAIQLDVVGPLALFHSTLVYGRALAAIVPTLAQHACFELDLWCWLHGDETHVRITLPVLLPPPRTAAPRPSVAEHLARDLADLGHAVDPSPPSLASGPHLLFPDLALDHRGARWHVEVLGFSTPQALARRLAHYRRADTRVALCVDLATAPGCDLRPLICGYTQRVDVDDLLATLAAAP